MHPMLQPAPAHGGRLAGSPGRPHCCLPCSRPTPPRLAPPRPLHSRSINQRNLLKGGGWWAQATEFLDWSDTERQKLIMPGVIELGLGRGPTFLPPDLPLATVRRRVQQRAGMLWGLRSARSLR